MHNDEAGPTQTRRTGRLKPLEWLSLVGYPLGGFFTIAVAFVEHAYRPEGRPALIATGIGLVGLGLAVGVRGRETPAQTMVQSLFSMIVITVCGYYAVSPILAMSSAAALGVTTLGIAIRCDPRPTLVLVALSPIAGVLTISRTGIEGWGFVSASCLIATVAVCPAIITTYYRRNLEIALDKLERLASTDGLTGLTNRHGMLNLVPLLFAEAERSRRRVGVLMADVDHFKKFNDAFGHQAGDEALKAVARIIRASVRQTDIVARYGGEEMCVVAAFGADDDFEIFAERIRKDVEASEDCGVTLSIGGYICHPSWDVPYSELLTSMVGKADEQLYAAKHGGRNAVHLAAA